MESTEAVSRRNTDVSHFKAIAASPCWGEPDAQGP